MLHDRKAQTGTTGLLGVAFVHPVKPFKNTILMLGGNTDSRIQDDHFPILQRNVNAATRHIVLDGIVAKIIDDLIQQPLNPAGYRK